MKKLEEDAVLDLRRFSCDLLRILTKIFSKTENSQLYLIFIK